MKKKEILIIFILAVLVTFLSFWWAELHTFWKLASFPYGPPSYPGILKPFAFFLWWLPPFVFAFWSLTLSPIWWVVKLVVRKVKPEKIELEKIADVEGALSKKHVLLIFIASILLMLVLSFTASKIFGYCQEIGKDIYRMFEQANYCQEDSDCMIFSDVQCPFGCSWPVNKDVDLEPIKERMSRYFSKGCQTCEYMCTAGIEKSHCLQGKCEIVEEISGEVRPGRGEKEYCQGKFLEDCAGKIVKVQGILRSAKELILESPTTPSKYKNVYVEPYWAKEGFVDERVEVIGKVVAGSVFPCLEEAKIQPPVTRTKDPISGKITCTAPTLIGVESIKLLGIEEVPYLDVAVADLTPEYDKKRACLYGEYSVGFEHQGLDGVWTHPAIEGSYTILNPQEVPVKGETSYSKETIACGLLRYSSQARDFGFGHMGMYPYLLEYDILIAAEGEEPRLEKIKDQSDCQKIRGKTRRDICFWNIARLESDPNICQSIRGEEIKSICFLDLARQLSNPEICDFSPAVPQEKVERTLQKAAYTNYSEQEMQGATMQDFCYAESEPKERSWCEKIMPIGVKEKCLAAVAKDTGEESICAQIEGHPYKKFCYAEVVIKKNDLSVCEKLPGVTVNPDGSITYPPKGEDLMGGCFWAYALLTGDRNVCDQVKDSNSQKVCRNAVWYK